MTMPAPPLPFEPEPLHDLRARYRASLTKVWPAIAPDDTASDVPAQYREHVFDFDDGVRLIVCRTRTYSGRVRILVSGVSTIVDGVQPEHLVQRYFDLAGMPRDGEIEHGGLDASGKIAWWTVKEGD